ncbi:cytidylate kinase [Borreliella chilensis]|uniref:Cytidylate kinase n=1 Tax=Borreliella chilensis TaxID=1245910 RepID=A0A0A7UUJ4_9SPIR|nr:cytidylate kinase [Borreliella chilensis]
MIIAIDGPSASGKSSIARELSVKLGYKFISSGYLYRIITLIAQRYLLNDCGFINENRLLDLIFENDISFNDSGFLLNGENVENQILNGKIDFQVSFYSSYIGIRNIVNKKLKEVVKLSDDNYIIEGRDITTVVFPESEFKIYLDASVEVRALRRYKQRNGNETLEELERTLKMRDDVDKKKQYGKLKLSEGVFYLDTSCKGLDDVCNIIIEKFNLKKVRER